MPEKKPGDKLGKDLKKKGPLLLAMAALGLALALGVACGDGQAQGGTAKSGDTVKVNYVGRLENGTIFDSSAGGDPLQFTIGAGDLLPDFEQAVIGMKVGETKTLEIPSDRAYGPRRDDLVHVMDRSELPSDITPEVGVMLELRQPDGTVFQVTIIEVSESTVTLDANYPLAGQDLTFDIKLIEIL